MSTLTAKGIADLVKGTLDHLGRMKFQQIAQELQDYEVMQRWLKTDKILMESGIGIQRTLMTKTGGSASHTGLFGTDTVNVADHLAQMTVPWRQAQSSWAFERRELLMNKGDSLVTNVIKPRRAGGMIDLAQELEEKAWAIPTSTNTTEPYGLPYWIIYTASTGAFTAANPSGHSAKAGIDATASGNSGFNNWTATYVSVTKADLIKLMRTGHRKIKFKSPVSIDDYRRGKGDKFRLYCNETTFSTFEDIGESQNENLGRDIASINGVELSFRKNPINWVPYLDSNAPSGTTNPIYMVNHDVFFPYILKGDNLRESEAIMAPGQHNVFQVFVDLSYNYLCVDPRRCAVFSQ